MIESDGAGAQEEMPAARSALGVSGRRARGDRYAVYSIEVRSAQGRSRRVSRVFRRYHDFGKLHGLLAQADPAAARKSGLRLPSRHIFSLSSLSESFLAERQGELQRYVDQLLAAQALMRTSAAQSFFLGATGGGDAGAGADAFEELLAADAGRRRALKVPWDSCMSALYVCLIRLPCMSALYVCLICLPDMSALYVRCRGTLSCLPCMSVLYVCLICLPCMSGAVGLFDVCLVCLSYTSA